MATAAPRNRSEHAIRQRVIGHLLGAWRRRWLGFGTAWIVCLSGWSAILLSGHNASHAHRALQAWDRVAAARVANALAAGGTAPDSAPRSWQAARERLTTLENDLAAALALGRMQAARSAELPPTLGGGQSNPLHERVLIVTLRREIAAEQARLLDLGGPNPPVSDGLRVAEAAAPGRATTLVGVPDDLAPPARAAIEAAGDGARAARANFVAPSPPRAGLTALLAGMLALAVAAGAAVAVWRGRLDRIVDDPWQLQERFGVPVLGVVFRPATAADRRREWVARSRFCLACLVLLALFGGLATAGAFDLLAPLGVPPHAPGLRGAAGMIIGIHYGGTPARRGARASLPERAARPLGFRITDPGAWRVPRAAASAAGEGEAAPGAEAPADRDGAASAGMVDRAQLIAGGYLDRDSGVPARLEELRPVAGALLALATAPEAGRRDRLILVTSANPSEGKTFIAVHLALALAHDGRSVLLVDGDPRTAGSTRALGLVPEPGLTDALGVGAAGDGLVRSTGLDHLRFMGPGRPQAALARMLASRRMAQLVRDLLAREPQGLVVVDGPPLLSGAAATALAMYAGQVVLVAAAGRSAEPVLAASLELLGERRNLGFVVTRAGDPPAGRNGPPPAPA